MKLSDVVNRINGNVDRFTTDLEYYVGGEHFDSNELAVTRKGMLKENLNVLGFKFHFAFQKRDVLFMARNPHLRKAGMVMFDGLCSDATYILRSKDENVLLQEYLALQLQSDHFWNYCESHKVGSVNFANNWTSIANYEFDLPSIEEQKVLADKLWAAYKVKESYRQLLSTTDEMLKAKFQEMFGDFLVNDRNWLTMPMSEVAPESPSKHGNKGNVWNLNLDMIESNTGIVIEKVYASFEDLNSVSAFDKGNVLYSKLRPYLNKVVVPDEEGYATTELIPLRPNPEFLNLCFFSHLLRSDKFVAYANSIATGTKMPRVPMDGLRKFNCILPPMELQQQFAEIATQAEATKTSLRASIEAIDRVIRSLINQ